MKKVTIVDYGLGNLASVVRALDYLGAKSEIVGEPDPISNAGHIILPGVGAFGFAMQNLCRRGLVEPLRHHAERGRPILGICLGMQLLFEESNEGGKHYGLGLIPGRVLKLQGSRANPVKIPHAGWSSLKDAGRDWSDTILSGLNPGDALYFLHSFYAQPIHKRNILATSSYGDINFCSIIEHGSVLGCQGHPEKSSHTGLRLIKNFLNMEI